VGEWEGNARALDDAVGSWVTVRVSCCEKRVEKRTLQKTLNYPTVVKVFENKFGLVLKTNSL